MISTFVIPRALYYLYEISTFVDYERILPFSLYYLYGDFYFCRFAIVGRCLRPLLPI